MSNFNKRIDKVTEVKTLALISKDFKRVIDQVRSGEVSLFIKFVKGELKIDGKVFPPGICHIPMDIELINEMDRHYEIRESVGKRRSSVPLPNNWAASCSGPFRLTHLLSARGKPIRVKLELMLDRIQYGQFKPSSYSEELSRAIQVHEDYWAEGKPGINQEANIKELMDEGFRKSVAMRIDKIVRKK
jgi:hypothetical protein